MIKLNTILITILFLIFNTITLFSQDIATVNWPLTDPASSGTGIKPTVTGSLSAVDELFQGTEITDYFGPNRSQRIRMSGTNNTWPANITEKIDTAYVQFSVSPNSGLSFYVSDISLNLAAYGSTTMKAEVYYSTEPDFSNPTLIEYSTGKSNNYLASSVFTEVSTRLNFTVPNGKTFYLRVYPWNEATSSSFNKYVCIQNVTISGVTLSSSSNELIITTQSVYGITSSSAICGGNILFDGGSAVTARGVCWNTTGSPNIADSKTSDSSGIGEYQSTLTGLSAATKYYVRAYAANASGTSYGNEVNFTTKPKQIPAFPGAEGYGRFTTGGRGGSVIEVINLNDDNNPGSFRYAVNQTGARTIVFRVSGTIHLKSSLSIKNGDLTIAGQTAPGDGICIAGFTPSINASNIIVRYMRFRLGDVNDIEDDAFNGRNQKDIIIDHCSMTWSVDECASFYDNENFTMQWCIVGESLYGSVHQKGDHGYGGIQGGMGATFHHNLYINNTSRNPRFCGARYHHATASSEIVDFVNNVIYNWGFESIYGGELGQQNVRANYYKPGPATKSGVLYRILKPSIDPGTNSGFGKFYVVDNFVEGYPNATADNWGTGVQAISSSQKDQVRVDQPFLISEVISETAEEAYQSVLNNVGPNFPKLDAVDARLINEARMGNATYEGKTYKQKNTVPDPTKMTGIIDTQTDVGGWPELNSLAAPTDTDHDGMPDYYETSVGLNSNDPSDGNLYISTGYTNLEVYLNGLVDGSVTSVKEQNTLPNDFTIEQNYPNPFNPETTISYSLPHGGYIDIKIFNIQGELVRQLYSGEVNAGSYRIKWNGKINSGLQVSSGMYFCTVNFANQLKTIKMLLLK